MTNVEARAGQADPKLARHFLGMGRFLPEEDLVYQIAGIEHAFWVERELGVELDAEYMAILAVEKDAYRQALDERRRRGYRYQRPTPGYDRDYLDELKRRVPILDVIGGGVKLRRQGKNYVGLCPFHDERTPSFTVFPATDSYFCFGCRHYGDAIDWLREIAGMDFRGAVETLEVLAGMPRGAPGQARPAPANAPAAQSPFIYKAGEVVAQ